MLRRLAQGLLLALFASGCGGATVNLPDPTVSVASVVVSPATVPGGTSAVGTVTLTEPSPAGGVSVTLSSSRTSAAVPAKVSVAVGATFATFTVTTSVVTADESAVITATLRRVTRTASLTVSVPPPGLASVTVSPTNVQGGASATGTVTLGGSAPAGGAVVTLTSSQASVVPPASVTVPAGAASATFTVATSVVAADQTVVITASLGSATRTASLTLTALPPVLVSVTVSLSTVQGGATATGTATLSGAAPAGGATVALASSRTTASVPASVTVAAGSASATFAITTTVVAVDETATITASHAGVDRTALLGITVTIPIPDLSSVALDPAVVQGGLTSTGTVTLVGPAGSGGVAVGLSSASPLATVPSTLAVAEGASSATFTVTTGAVGAGQVVPILATLSGVSRSATLDIRPPSPPAPCALRTPGAQWLAYSSKRNGIYNLYAMRDDGTCPTQVTYGAGDDLYVSWSPAGLLAYMSSRNGNLAVFVRDFIPGAEAPLEVGALRATGPAFSPDGRFIAFEGYQAGVNGVSQIYVVPTAGGAPVQLTAGSGFKAAPAWSTDASTIYFVSNRVDGAVTGYNIWTVPSGGGVETRIPGTTFVLGRVGVSPIGNSIAYSLPSSGASTGKVVKRDMTRGVVTTVTDQSDWDPTFDATGTKMVVTSFRNGNPDLILVDVATGAVIRQLVSDPGNDGAAAYAPFP